MGLALLLTFLFGGRNAQHPGNTGVPYATFGFCFMYCFAALITQIKQLFATPLASLLPGYRVPHLVVALILAVPVLVVVPLLVSLGLQLPILPLLGLTVAFCALVAWGVYRNSVPFMGLALALWFAPSLFAAYVFLWHFLTDNTLATALGGLLLLGAGVVGFAFFVRRLLRLNEEMPEYARNVPTNYWDSLKSLRSYRPATRVNYQSRWGQFFYDPYDADVAALAATGHWGFWRRVARWRMAQSTRRAMIPVAVMMAFMTGLGLRGSGEGGVIFAVSQLLMVPMYLILVRQVPRQPMLGYESLRPVTRRAYLKENALAIGLQAAELWLLMAVLLVLEMAVLVPGVLGTPQPWLLLGGTALVQPLMVAIALRLLRVQYPLLLLSIGVAFAFAVPLGIIFSDVVLHLAYRWQALIGALLVVASGLMLAEAYRYWLRVDLE